MFDPHDFLAIATSDLLGHLVIIICGLVSGFLPLVYAILIARKKRRDAEASVAQPSEDQNKQPDD